MRIDLAAKDRQRYDIDKSVMSGPDRTVADVSLFDRPAMEPAGAGNFWSLALIGLVAFGFVAVVVALILIVR